MEGVSAKLLVPGRQHPWEAADSTTSPGKMSKSLKTWRFSERHHIHGLTYYILIMLETLCGIFFGVPIHHTSPAQNIGTACMGDGCRMSQSTSTKMTEVDRKWPANSWVCWLMVSPCFNPKKKKTKAQGSSSHHPSGFNPSQLHRQWHPLPFFRGTAWQSRSGGPPACACALDMRPGPQMMFCLTIELSSTNRTVKATDLLFGGPFLWTFRSSSLSNKIGGQTI